MAQIQVIRDTSIKHPDIVLPLIHTTEEQSESKTINDHDVMQTEFTGIMHPIVAIDGILVLPGDITYFCLDSTESMPQLKVDFTDSRSKFSEIGIPSTSNNIQVQILPPYEGVYKKIDMLFYATDWQHSGNSISLRGRLKNIDLNKSRFNALGEITTYELLDKISTETGYGFASNVTTTEDPRFITLRHQSYEEILQSEIKNSIADETKVYDWWIDFWNNIILCDLFDRYSKKDDLTSAENQIAVSFKKPDPTIDGLSIKSPKDYLQIVEPIFSNMQSLSNSELYVVSCEPVTRIDDNIIDGATRVISTYNIETMEYIDHIVMDGDVKVDNVEVYEYGGEYYGGYNYILSSQCRDLYLRKINSENVIVRLNRPIFGLARGDQVKLLWTEVDNYAHQQKKLLQDNGEIDLDALNLGWIKEVIDSTPSDNDIPFNINVELSGQYTIVGIKIVYEDYQWKCDYTLARPAIEKPKLIDKKAEDETKINAS